MGKGSVGWAVLVALVPLVVQSLPPVPRGLVWLGQQWEGSSMGSC